MVTGVRRGGRNSVRRGGGRQGLLGGETGPRCARSSSGTRSGGAKARRRRSSPVPARWPPQPGAVARKDGDVAAGHGRRRQDASTPSYEFPYLAHAPMEPMNCVVRLHATAARSGAASSSRPSTSDAAARSRRPQAGAGQAQHAVCRRQLRPARQSGSRILRWRRRRSPRRWRRPAGVAGETGVDARGRHARRLLPAAVSARAEAGLDARRQRWSPGSTASSASRSSPARRSKAMMVKDGIDATSVEGAADCPTTFPTCGSSCIRRRSACRCCGGARSGSTHTAFVDRNLHRRSGAGRRPGSAGLAPRPAGEASRATRGCWTSRAETAGWGTPLRRQGRRTARPRHRRARIVQHLRRPGGRGDASRQDGRFKVDRVVCAVDCGIAVNPDVIRAQMEGGIGFGLSAALYGAITLKDGRGRAVQFPRLPGAAHQRDAEGRGAYRAVGRAAHRRRRARRAADRAGGGQRPGRGDRQAPALAALRLAARSSEPEGRGAAYPGCG